MWCAYNILVCAVYWICECTPLAITSLLPVVLLPLTGVSSTEEVCGYYMTVIYMYILEGYSGQYNYSTVQQYMSGQNNNSLGQEGTTTLQVRRVQLKYRSGQYN